MSYVIRVSYDSWGSQYYMDVTTAEVPTQISIREYSSLNFDYPPGKDFTSWNTQSDGSGTTYYPGDIIYSVTESMTILLYPVFVDVTDYKLVDSAALDNAIQTIANALKAKNSTSGQIVFPDGFLTEIAKLTNTYDANAVSGDVRTGKTAYVGGQKVTGNLPVKAAAIYNTSTSDQTISANQILDGAQTIKAVTTENIDAANIKPGVTMKVGDANNAGRIKNVTSTMIAKSAATYNTSTSDQTISANQFLSGAQTIKAVTTSNIDAANIKSGVVVKVGDANSAGRIKNVTGSYLSTPVLEKYYTDYDVSGTISTSATQLNGMNNIYSITVYEQGGRQNTVLYRAELYNGNTLITSGKMLVYAEEYDHWTYYEIRNYWNSNASSSINYNKLRLYCKRAGVEA